MLREYGFGTIEIDGVIYEVSPTFKNIDKIGSPMEIVEILKNLNFGQGHTVFRDALNVVNSCSNKPLPYSYKVTMKGGLTKLISPPKEIDIAGLIQVAKHCLTHGVLSGKKAKRGDGGQQISEFNVAEYVRSAMMIFDISREEASNMTMTEFVSMCNDKLPDVEEGVNLSGKEKRNLIIEQMERDKKNRGK